MGAIIASSMIINLLSSKLFYSDMDVNIAIKMKSIELNKGSWTIKIICWGIPNNCFF